MIRTHSRYVIIGAGIHGLSTAWHLARELRARGLGGGEDILVLDKRGPGAGASGIACGTVRNNYFQPAMRELMAHSVSVWESDPDAFSYHPVGFLQIAPEAIVRRRGAGFFSEQRAIGYPSVLIEGKSDCQRYLLDMFEDWQAPGSTTVLHEKKGGYANNIRAVRGLAAKAEAEGVRIAAGVRVTGFGIAGNAVTSVETDQGTVACDQLVIAVGPWIRDLWAWLDLPETITWRSPAGPEAQPGRCGPTGRCRRARWRSSRPSSPTTGAPSRPLPTWTPTSRSMTTSAVTCSQTVCGASITSRISISLGCRAAARPMWSASPPGPWPSTRTARRAPSTRCPMTSFGCGRRGWPTATRGSRESGTSTGTSRRAESAPSPRTASPSSTFSIRTPT